MEGEYGVLLSVPNNVGFLAPGHDGWDPDQRTIGPTSLEDAYVRMIDTGNGAVDENQTSDRVLATVA